MIDQIPPSLRRFAAEYERAARRELATAPEPKRPRRRTFRLAAAGSAALAAVAMGVVLTIGATTGATPAYALTQNADGSITISLNNLTTGISELNVRLHQMGINDTVIPVTQSCPTTTPVLDAGPGSLSETITIGSHNDEPAGVDGYLAAEQLPDGSIALAIGGMKAPLPSCFAPTLMKTQPESTASSGVGSTAATAGRTGTIDTSAPPVPLSGAQLRGVNAQLKAARSHATSITTATTQSLPPTRHSESPRSGSE